VPRGAVVPAGACCCLVEHWLFSPGPGPGILASTFPLAGCGTEGSPGWRGLGTLLGPEEASVPLYGQCDLRGGCRAGLLFRLLLENCIVDASIFCNLL
jgi:hypothetical protein